MITAMLQRTLSGLVFCLTVCLPACAPPELPQVEDSSGQGEPSIEIIYPESSQTTVYCSTFMVAVDIENFTVEPIVDGAANADGIGHWHLLDSAEYLTAADKEYAFVPADKALSPGTHNIVATLAQNDHQLLDPPVAWSIEILVGETQADGVTPCTGQGGGGSSSSDTGMDY